MFNIPNASDAKFCVGCTSTTVHIWQWKGGGCCWFVIDLKSKNIILKLDTWKTNVSYFFSSFALTLFNNLCSPKWRKICFVCAKLQSFSSFATLLHRSRGEKFHFLCLKKASQGIVVHSEFSRSCWAKPPAPPPPPPPC